MENPNFELPGLAFFHQNVSGSPFSVGPRFAAAVSHTASIPLSSTSNNIATLPINLLSPAVVTDGIYIEDLWAAVTPSDNSQALTLISGQMNLAGTPSLGPGNVYQLGIFVLTQNNPANLSGFAVALRDAQKLITVRDLSPQGGLNSFAPTDTGFVITANVAAHNSDAAAAHAFVLTLACVYRIVHGLYE